MFKAIRNLLGWIDDRSGLVSAITPVMNHRVPRDAKWWYVFGSATLMFFMVQILTGICLALVYVPDADGAYESLVYINEQVPFGWWLRALHGWSANAMVLMMILHMTQIVLHATYKYPRELTWCVGVLLFVCTLGLAFTGEIMRWDTDSYWGVGIGAAIMGRVPFVGEWLTHLVLGGPIIGGETLSRFFALHVFVLPGVTIGLVGLHLLLVLKNGISEMPRPGEVVDKRTYREQYEARMESKGVPFFPDAAQRDMVFIGCALLVVVGLAAWFGPFGPNEPPIPTDINVNPRPDFSFLWMFAVLALLTPQIEDFLLITAMPIGLVFLLALPFISNQGERAPSRRPLTVLVLVLVYSTVAVLTVLGLESPWSPKMDAWSEDPTPPHMLQGRSPLQLMGAIVIQNSQCRNCHALDGVGGMRGPDLSDAAVRLSHDQLVRQVQQGGGNMPAYGRSLSAAETAAVTSFLDTMHPVHQTPAFIPGADLEGLRKLR